MSGLQKSAQFESLASSRPVTPTSVRKLKSLLRQTLRVMISDGRIFLGTFVGTDKQMNVLLVNTEEFRIGVDNADGNPSGRFVGQVMIPWRLIQTVEVSTDEVARSRDGVNGDDDSMYA